jgi:hypothetical protein
MLDHAEKEAEPITTSVDHPVAIVSDPTYTYGVTVDLLCVWWYLVAGVQGQGGTLHELVASQASRIDRRIEAELFITLTSG